MDHFEILEWPVRCLSELFDTCTQGLIERETLVWISATVQALKLRRARGSQGAKAAPLSASQKRALATSVIIDTIVGVAVGTLLLRHRGRLQAAVVEASQYLVESVLIRGIEWLMSVAPAGLKLNEELDMLMGRTFLSILKVFSQLGVRYQAPLLRSAFWTLALCAPLGLSTLLALSSDLLALATCHVSLLHWLASLTYSAQLRALAALWRLFRGRKLNPLRHRVDSFEYTVEQVVVGSLLFTLLLLLLPTTWAYYSLCVMAYGGIAAARVALQLVGAAVRSFPFYSLAVWAVVPGAFPVAVSFQVTSEGRVIEAGKGLTKPAGSQLEETRSGWNFGTRSSSLSRNPGIDPLDSPGEVEASKANEGARKRTRHMGRAVRPGSCSGSEGGAPEQAGTKVSSRARKDEGEAFHRQAAMVCPDSGRPQEQAGGGCVPVLGHVPNEEELGRRHLRLEMVTADAADILQHFLGHVTSPFSLVGAARVASALLLVERLYPVLTFQALAVDTA